MFSVHRYLCRVEIWRGGTQVLRFQIPRQLAKYHHHKLRPAAEALGMALGSQSPRDESGRH